MGLLTMMTGPAGAGKTTVARRLEAHGALRVSMDEATWEAGHRGTEAPRAVLDAVYAALRDAASARLEAGGDVVADLSMSTRAVRDEWRELGRAAGADVELVVVTAPIEVLWRRIVARQGVDDANAVVLDRPTLERYVDGFEWPGDDEPHRRIDTSEA